MFIQVLRNYVSCLASVVLLVLIHTGFEPRAIAQTNAVESKAVEAKATESKTVKLKDRPSSPRKDPPRYNASYAGITHELITSVQYRQASGTTTAGSGDSKTEVKKSLIDATVGYGFIFSNLTEIYCEAAIKVTSNKLDDFEENVNNMDIGLGLLFNAPLTVSDPANLRDWRGTQWIPYGGLLITSLSRTHEVNAEVQAKETERELVNKLVLGNRFLFSEHVSFTSQLRAFYQTATIARDAEAGGSTTDGDDGGNVDTESRKLTIELQVLGLSLLF